METWGVIALFPLDYDSFFWLDLQSSKKWGGYDEFSCSFK